MAFTSYVYRASSFYLFGALSWSNPYGLNFYVRESMALCTYSLVLFATPVICTFRMRMTFNELLSACWPIILMPIHINVCLPFGSSIFIEAQAFRNVGSRKIRTGEELLLAMACPSRAFWPQSVDNTLKVNIVEPDSGNWYCNIPTVLNRFGERAYYFYLLQTWRCPTASAEEYPPPTVNETCSLPGFACWYSRLGASRSVWDKTTRTEEKIRKTRTIGLNLPVMLYVSWILVGGAPASHHTVEYSH